MTDKMHLDADTLAAFAEHSLTADEQAAAFSHLSECEVCRQYLAAFSDLKNFRWQQRPRSRRAGFLIAAGIACVLAAASLLFHWQSPRRHSFVAGSQQFVSLAHLSFTDQRAARPALNQIVVTTSLGERWITVPGVWDHPVHNKSKK